LDKLDFHSLPYGETKITMRRAVPKKRPSGEAEKIRISNLKDEEEDSEGESRKKSKPINAKETLARQTEWLHRTGAAACRSRERGDLWRGKPAKLSALDPTQPASLALSWWGKATTTSV
jgi:hypothetical protein